MLLPTIAFYWMKPRWISWLLTWKILHKLFSSSSPNRGFYARSCGFKTARRRLVFVQLLASCNHASLFSVWYRSEESLFHQNAIKVAYTFNSKSFLFSCFSNIKHFLQVCCRILAVRDLVAMAQNIIEMTVKNSGFQPFCRRGTLSLHPKPLRTPSLFQRFFFDHWEIRLSLDLSNVCSTVYSASNRHRAHTSPLTPNIGIS